MTSKASLCVGQATGDDSGAKCGTYKQDKL